MAKKKYSYTEVRIRGVAKNLNKTLKNIADHKGVTISQLLKPYIREFADSFPPHIKEPMDLS